MTDSSRKKERLSELQTALQALNESESTCANTAARYAELEAIIRKQIKSQFTGVVEAPSRTESNTSCKTDGRSVSSIGSSSKYSFKSTKKTFARYPEKVPSKKNESTESLLKKSIGDVGKTSPEQSTKGQLLKRIRQCHDSIDDVAMLSERIISERKKFLVRLDKSNRDVWKSQKAKHPLVGKLEKHISK